MAERTFIPDYAKNEKLRDIQKKIKIGTTGKTKLCTMKRLLERNSEQIKGKITEYFEKQRRLLNERETKLLNKVNMFVDCRITELDDKLMDFQEKLDHLSTYQQCLERNKLPNNSLLSDDFDHYIAASRYDFCTKRDDIPSAIRKLGTLKQVDVLVARLDSDDETDDDDHFLKGDISRDMLTEKVKKAAETELSDTASSCSVLSYKEIGEEIDSQMEMGCMDDYEYLTLESPCNPFYTDSVSQVGKTLCNLNLCDDKAMNTTDTFEREKIIEKTLEVFKNIKGNRLDITGKITDQVLTENKFNKLKENRESNIDDKIISSIEIGQPRNEQKDTLARASCVFKHWPTTVGSIMNNSGLESQKNNPAYTRTAKSIDCISNFNSKVKIILDKSDSKMLNSIC